jgi:TM2 domain-containing membrane protein YozV
MNITCYVHNERSSIGTCIGCGKFICDECNTEIQNKNYCKNCVNEIFVENKRKIEKLEDNSNQAPMVFMNAGGGGGGGGGSSSSAAAASSGDGRIAVPIFTKSRVTAGVLAILLGGIGVHKFYLGKTGWGIVYLIFCWTYIPSLIGLIEGIIYLASTDQSFAIKHDRHYIGSVRGL